ncbi:MAG: cytochrome P450 [Polyangiales bacterium]
MATTANGVYYDPYDFEIDKNPYPIWKRLRDEQPVYYNEKYDFYALSRYDDVERCSKDWRKYSSARGTLLELIKTGMEIPPGSIIFEDPPTHDLHRALVSGMFSPRKMAGLEAKVRDYCARSLDPKVGTGGFDFIADIGAMVPMRTIGMLLGIPEEDQIAIREKIDDGLRLTEGAPPPVDMHERLIEGQTNVFAEYIEWRSKNPSDDVVTELLRAEFEDTNGVRRRLERDELLGFVNLIAAAGNETTTRLIGWAGKVLAENPDQRRELVNNLSLVPRAVEELLRYESPSPVQARYVTEDVEHYGVKIKEGSVAMLLTASANRDERRFEDPDAFNIHRGVGQHVAFGYGVHFCLGASLARLEARIALEEILKRFPEWDVDWDNAVQAHTSTVRGWQTLPVKTRS